jgi:hypothetical protein
MTPTFVIVTGAYAVAGLVLLAVVVGCLWDGWRDRRATCCPLCGNPVDRSRFEWFCTSCRGAGLLEEL